MRQNPAWTIQRAVLIRPSPAGFLRLMLQSHTPGNMTQSCRVEILPGDGLPSEVFEEDFATPRSVHGEWVVIEIKPIHLPSIVLRLCPDDAALEREIRTLILCVGSDRIELLKKPSGIYREAGALSGEAN